VVLEKFKDKAAVVGKAAAEALDAMARYSFSLVDVAEVSSATVCILYQKGLWLNSGNYYTGKFKCVIQLQPDGCGGC
jgi:hypothetical protein